MDQQVTRLVNKIWVKYCSTPDDARIMVAISGIPGSGKTGLATMMATRINEIHASENITSPSPRPIAIAIPMDGYHLTRAQLAAMPDPVYAAARRGAAFTFDGEKFLSLVRDLRQPIHKQTVNLYAPSFDHAVKDPVDGDIVIPADCRVVFFEGNYLSLNREPWSTAAALMDELWFVDVDFEVARKRLVLRHIKAGIAKDAEEADKRARENDLVNGKEIVEERLPVQEVVSSIFDPIWEKS
ncbi:Phosphoribulokinase/uridine kinase [Penicillium bovifimosum]|uniref:Phosphoribulokinase/uridine kinase n=1 Tax=Penicillium bovifimosum TaxID=126998 RepID=A0A9W9HC72_9EURO|nr:Phosphoribulokinase/uridine kinase [Penicillium bovifimosum]KAJ5144005.1 Phosphoribulokinase/uridine kinase [Penicillium bovifimosum]